MENQRNDSLIVGVGADLWLCALPQYNADNAVLRRNEIVMGVTDREQTMDSCASSS